MRYHMTSDSIGSPSYGALTVRSWYDNGVSEMPT